MLITFSLEKQCSLEKEDFLILFKTITTQPKRVKQHNHQMEPLWWKDKKTRPQVAAANWGLYHRATVNHVSGKEKAKEWFISLTEKLKVKVSVTQSCPTLCSSTECSPPGSPVDGILQARIVEWVTVPFSMGSSQPRDRTRHCRFFTIWATREPL